MQINITSLLEQKGTKLTCEGKEPFLDDDARFPAGLCLRFTLTNVGKSILVEGTASGDLSTQCANCLRDFQLPISFTLSEEFFSSRNMPADADPHVSLEELSIFTYGEDNLIDLKEAVRQAVLLNLPLHPTCSPDCKGLCPACGKNKNEGDCGCREEFSDERWAPLKALERSLRSAPKKANRTPPSPESF